MTSLRHASMVLVLLVVLLMPGHAQEPAKPQGDAARIAELEQQVKALTTKAQTLTPAEQAERMRAALADTSKRVDEAVFATVCKQAKWKVRVVVDTSLKFTVTCER